MRVYLPLTLPTLANSAAGGQIEAVDGVAHAVTPALREWYTEGDAEELEYAAMLDAAGACLRLLAADDGAPRRRLVVAADVPTAAPAEQAGRSAVRLPGPVPWSSVVSLHVDEAEARDDVAAAVQALPAADSGDEEARFTVDAAAGHDLLWYDVSEVEAVLSGL